MAGQQQLVHHVQDDQRRHPIEGETLPGFGKRQGKKAFWVTEVSTSCRVRQLDLVPHNLRDRLTPSELLNQLLQAANLSHQRIDDFFYANTADHALDEGTIGMDFFLRTIFP